MKTNDLELKTIIKGIGHLSSEWIEKARKRTNQLVMPRRALGRLHDISERICGIQNTLSPSIHRKAYLVMVGDHGVVNEGVSAYPQAVTAEMIKTFLMGGAGINVLSQQIEAKIIVVDMGVIPELKPDTLEGGNQLLIHKVANGTANFARGPAIPPPHPGCGSDTTADAGGAQLIGCESYCAEACQDPAQACPEAGTPDL